MERKSARHAVAGERCSVRDVGRRSMQLMAEKVMPAIQRHTAASAAA
jgi:hypothetical protein